MIGLGALVLPIKKTALTDAARKEEFRAHSHNRGRKRRRFQNLKEWVGPKYDPTADFFIKNVLPLSRPVRVPFRAS